MSYSQLIGKRYLSSKKKRTISIVGIIAIFSVAVGVAALSLVFSIASGFLDEFTKKILGVNAHVLVMKYSLDFNEYRDVIKTSKKVPGVREAAPFIIQEMMLTRNTKTATILLKGVDPQKVHKILDLPEYIIEGEIKDIIYKENDPHPPGIIVGRTLAENLNIKTGDEVTVTTPLIGLDALGWSPSSDTPKSVVFKVAGIFYAGFLEYDTKLAYVDYLQAQKFFDSSDSVTGVEITVNDIHNAKKISDTIRVHLGGGPYHTVDWEMLNASLFTALKYQRIILIVVVTMIVVMAAFNIIATLVMMVFDKKREIAILRSMGATKAGIAGIFVNLGMTVGFIGILAGLAVGVGSCYLLHKVGWPLDPDVYLIDHLPIRLNPFDFAATAAVALLISFCATIIPSISAARLRPLDGLRKD